MKIIGVDPGTKVVGYGVVEKTERDLFPLVYGAITVDGNAPLPARLKIIYRELSQIIETHRPDVFAIEEVFYGKNIQSALTTGEGRGVAILAAANADIPVVEYAATRIKKAVVGMGKAHKSQVQQMVKIILQLPTLPHPFDASDALAIAICHCHTISVNP